MATWFERLTGFREESCGRDASRAQARGRYLHSLVNGRSHGIGQFELPSLRTLRERAARQALDARPAQGEASLPAMSGRCTGAE